jgi:Rrf2 family protein
MKSNSSAEAALHLVVLLALTPKGKELAATDLAGFHHLSKSTIAKVLQQLACAHIIVASSGRSGGYQLKRPAQLISVYDVAAAIDGVEPHFHCNEIRRSGPCTAKSADYSPRCAVARVMDTATQAWRTSLKSVSIADLAKMSSQEAPKQVKNQTSEWLALHFR